MCRIEGSRLIPLSQLPARLGELDPERATVVICHHGVRSLGPPPTSSIADLVTW